MKKRLLGIIALLLAVMMFALVGCKPKKTPDDDNTGVDPPVTDGGDTPSDAGIKIRGSEEQSLRVGDTYEIQYSVKGSKSEVEFTSSDKDVVTVDKFAQVTGVGVGDAKVTLSLKDDPTVKADVTFSVTRDNFLTDSTHKNGSITFGEQEKGGEVKITGGQTQLLANAAGQHWYFKTTLTHEGFAEGDSTGFWGVGSFLVNSANPIGQTMFWFMLRNETSSESKAAYGGWRYETSITQDRTLSLGNDVHDISKGVKFTIIRYGTMHYMIADFGGGDILKHSFDVPLFDSVNTYPGVFSQRQKLSVTDYSMSNDTAEVEKLLETFQLAESVSINGITDKLTTGSYNLTSTVEPALTFNKSVTYALKTPVNGISVSSDGALTIANTVAAGTQFTVVGTAVSDTSRKGEKTYTVISKPQSTSDLFDTGMVINNSQNPMVYPQDDMVFSRPDSTQTYIPLVASADKWMVTADVVNSSAGSPTYSVDGTEIGIMSATGGYMNYAKLGINYSVDSKVDAAFTEISGASTVLAKAAKGGNTSGVINKLGLIKDGATYYITINDRLVKKLSASFAGNTTPVLYALGAGAEFRNVTATTTAADIDSYLASEKLYVGSYVEKNGDVYTLNKVDFGTPGPNNGDTLDWPPDNDYANGIKSAKSFTGSYEIEFTLSNVIPDYTAKSGEADAKILVYLKSERVTSSLQFTIKGTSSNLRVKFVANLDDNSWTEYDLPQGVNLMSGSTTVKVVKTAEGVELYLNGVRAYEGESYMSNTGYWDNSTVATPGIGTFMCGATITDPQFKVHG